MDEKLQIIKQEENAPEITDLLQYWSMLEIFGREVSE